MLNLHTHMMAQDSPEVRTSRAKNVAYFIGKEVNNHGKTNIVVSWWHVVPSDRQIKRARSLITQRLLDYQ